MSATGHCPECGSELPPGAPEGLCPACLLRAGIEQPASGGSSADPAVDPTSVSPPEPRFIPPSPEELAERFPHLEILELLGQGGMGAVYKARQPQLDRFVALKILPPELGRDPTFSERFSREARALAQLSHPHIVTVYDYGRAGDLCYFVMEYVDGTNLRQVIDAGAMQPAEALAIIPQICTALEYAHQEGIVHRDIKPENILLDKRGRVKIADFGLSKLIGDVPPDISLTGTHQVMGTLRYMAPEQMQGTKGVDHRADIYSLGVVFYELLTGEVPMGRFAPPSRKVEVDVRLDEIVLRALEQEPAKRYQRASEVKTDLESLDSGAPPVTAAPSEEPPGEGPWLTVAGTASTAVSAAILVGAGLILFLHGGEIFDEVSGALRLGVEVRNVAIGLLQVAGALMLLMGSVTVFGGWPDGVWATILLLMGYLMWYVASPWVLAGLVLPWFALGYFEARDRDGWPVTLCVPVTLGLIVYGMLLSQSFWPLLGLLSVAAGFFAAHCVLALKEC